MLCSSNGVALICMYEAIERVHPVHMINCWRCISEIGVSDAKESGVVVAHG